MATLQQFCWEQDGFRMKNESIKKMPLQTFLLICCGGFCRFSDDDDDDRFGCK